MIHVKHGESEHFSVLYTSGKLLNHVLKSHNTRHEQKRAEQPSHDADVLDNLVVLLTCHTKVVASRFGYSNTISYMDTNRTLLIIP